MLKSIFKLTSIVCFFITALSCQQKETSNKSETKKKPNILFIAVDDLRPELGCYGSEIAVSPNLDALASKGVLFNRAYCQQAICGPSRASIMTGARPESIGVVENYAHFRDLVPDIVTLPQKLKENGYETVFCGKIFHGKKTDDKLSWSRKPSRNKLKISRQKTLGGYALAENRAMVKKKKEQMIAKYGKDATKMGLTHGPAFESADVPDETYDDGYNTQLAIATLKDMVENSDKPFFLGLGFKKPHLNFVAPKKYWDIYNRDEIPLSKYDIAPKNGAEMGLHSSFELRVRAGIPKTGAVEPELARTLKHGYLACVSYIDAQIGKMIAALEEAGVSDNTIIVVWGDHGWHLGDMGIWGKATNYEIATRVPLIVYTPDLKPEAKGKKSDALVELVDIYPTLCDLAGVEIPEHTEGVSFKPLLAEPTLPWKKAVFSQFPSPALREWAANPLSEGMRETFFGPLIKEVEGRIKTQQKEKWDRGLFENRLMGYGMRTDQYRLIVWKDYLNPKEDNVFVELYDHQKDKNETNNIATDNPKLVDELLEQFNKGWKGNVPKCCSK